MQGKHQRWWEQKHERLLSNLLASVLKHQIKIMDVKEINHLVMLEMNQDSRNQAVHNRQENLFPTITEAKQLSSMLVDNPLFNEYLVLVDRGQGQWGLQPGDDGLVR